MNKKKYPWEKDIVSVSRTGTGDYGTGGTPSDAKPNYSGTRDNPVVKPTTPKQEQPQSIADLIASMGYTDANKKKSEEYYAKAENIPFSFDLNGNALYNQYKDHYTKQAEMAREDAIGRAVALTGGYGNSYAMNAGQQMYDARMDELNNVIPELYNMAYNQWNNERQHNLDMGDRYAQMDAQEYSNALQLAQTLSQEDENSPSGDISAVPKYALEALSGLQNNTQINSYLNQLMAGGVIDESQGQALAAMYGKSNEISTSDAADYVSMITGDGEWQATSDGGFNWLGGMDRDAYLIMPNGESIKTADLFRALKAQGMKGAEARKRIIDLQNKLGIRG